MPNFAKALEEDFAAHKHQALPKTERELLIEIRDLLKEMKESFERYAGASAGLKLADAHNKSQACNCHFFYGYTDSTAGWWCPIHGQQF